MRGLLASLLLACAADVAWCFTAVPSQRGGAPTAACRRNRAPSPRAALVDLSAAAAPDALLLRAPTLLVADGDVFGEVFAAGMSIAFAAIAATVFVGIVVNGRYDEIEQSFFEAQDKKLSEDQSKFEEKAKSSTAVSDFFGDLEPQQGASSPAPASSNPQRAPADQQSPS